MYKVSVDDGHGEETVGKRTPNGYFENEFNNGCKQYLITELKRNGFQVVDCSPTRQDNSLQNRVDIANKSNADIFVSIHFNAMGNVWQDEVEGLEIYYHNSSVNGKKLATLIHDQLIQGTKMNDRGIKSDYTLYNTGLAVLRDNKMPAVLIEAGFMDNKKDFLLMKSENYRKECAQEICKGICNYFQINYKAENSAKDYKEILKEVSPWADIYISDINNILAKTGHNWSGLIEKLYYTIPKK